MRVLKGKQNMKNWYGKPLLYWCLVILFSWLLQVALTPSLFAQNRAPYENEVAVYEHVNFVGNQRIYALEPGMRQKLVWILPNDIDRMISSIQVGAKVGVMFFTGVHFRDEGNATLQSISQLPPEYNDKISSLIIFPKEWKAPLGVEMIGWYYTPGPVKGQSTGVIKGQFFAAPEKMSERTAFYPDIGYELNDRTHEARLFPGTETSPVCKQIWVKLFEHANFGGRSITIPGPGSSLYVFQLSDYQFSKITSSLQVTASSEISIQKPLDRPLQERPARQLQKR